jgi:hypothetical protein
MPKVRKIPSLSSLPRNDYNIPDAGWSTAQPVRAVWWFAFSLTSLYKQTGWWGVTTARDENGFGNFRYSGNRFQNFSIRFTGNGIFRKWNRFSEFSIEIGVVFYRPFPSVTDFCRKLPDLRLEIFGKSVSEFFWNFLACDFFRIAYTSLDKDYLFLYFLDALIFFWDRWCWKAVEINDLVSWMNPPFSIHMLCISNI